MMLSVAVRGWTWPAGILSYTARMRNDPLAFLGDEIPSLKEQKLYRRLRVLDKEQQATASFDGRSVVNLSSNNYLGLSAEPEVVSSDPFVRWSI